MELDEIRKLIIVAMFSDDVLYDRFVLKGGNALSMVHGYQDRASIDLDFSMHDDVDDLQDFEDRITKALDSRFRMKGYVVFDQKLKVKPSDSAGKKEGGYSFEFKLNTLARKAELSNRRQLLRQTSVVMAPGQKKTFKIDISKFEFCEGAEEHLLDDFDIRVYSLEMIAVEKLRAICQQCEGYPIRRRPTPRARDFFDIHTIIRREVIDLLSEENISLINHVFKAKEAPLTLLNEFPEQREFHRSGWPSVEDAVPDREQLEEFDHYFDAIVDLAQQILEKTSRIE